MTFEQLTRGMTVEVEIPKAGEPGTRWVRAKVVGFSKGRTRVHLDFEGHDWGLALTKSDVKTRVRAPVTATPDQPELCTCPCHQPGHPAYGNECDACEDWHRS